MKIRYALVIIPFLLTSCELGNVSLKDRPDLIGRWLKLGPYCDSCSIYEFDDANNLIIEFIHGNDFDSLLYKLPDAESIVIISEDKEIKYDLIYHTNDSIEIVGFTLSAVGVIKKTVLKRL